MVSRSSGIYAREGLRNVGRRRRAGSKVRKVENAVGAAAASAASTAAAVAAATAACATAAAVAAAVTAAAAPLHCRPFVSRSHRTRISRNNARASSNAEEGIARSRRKKKRQTGRRVGAESVRNKYRDTVESGDK